MRNFNRNNDELRNVNIEILKDHFSYGACNINFGLTKILCTATVDDNLPKWLKGKNMGWITAEYSMLPGATEARVPREITVGKKSPRSTEIQRFIGRSVRSAVDLKALKGIQILLDCDVIQADGGTRTASITGAFVALNLALRKLLKKEILKKNPVNNFISSVSCGIVENKALLDLDYQEDSKAEVDANFVFSENSEIIEIQASGEKRPFSKNQFNDMFVLASKGIQELIIIQKKALKP